MILQGCAFKVSHSWISLLSVELRPSSTPPPPSDSQFHYHRASSPSPVPDPGEDNSNSNPKTFISSCIISIHVFLWGLGAKQINIHCTTIADEGCPLAQRCACEKGERGPSGPAGKKGRPGDDGALGQKGQKGEAGLSGIPGREGAE
ncbi:hypothetical protein AMECASPLE_038322, partial [Ameca splendens]